MTSAPTLSGQGQCQGPILARDGLSWAFRTCYGPFLWPVLFGSCPEFPVPNAARQSQGDPLAAFLFALSIDPVLRRIQDSADEAGLGAGVFAQIDDAYIVGPRDWAVAAYEEMRAGYAAIGLELRDDKGVVYSPGGIAAEHVHIGRDGTARLAGLGVPVVAGGVALRRRGAFGDEPDEAGPVGVVAIGSAVGTAEFQARAARRACCRSARLIHLLHSVVADPQVLCLLVRQCALTRMTYMPHVGRGQRNTAVSDEKPTQL